MQNPIASSQTPRFASNERLAAALLRAVDAGLVGCILIVPLLMGGRHAVGQLVLIGLALGVAVVWASRQTLASPAFWRPTYAAFLLALGLALLLLQLIPLGQGAAEVLTPGQRALLPLWETHAEGSVGLTPWPCASLTPEATRGAISVFVAYALIFLVCVQRIGEVEDIERLLRWCAIAAVGMAALGLAQCLAGNGKFLWFHEAPYSSTLGGAKGSFTNRNHFAHFLALGIGPLVWWLHRTYHGSRGRRSARASLWGQHSGASDSPGHLLAVATGVVLFAGLLSLSRGGNIAIVRAATVSTLGWGRAAAVRGHFLAGLAATGLLISIALGVFGYERVSDRLDDLASGSLDVLDPSEGRRRIWKADLQAVPDFALLGAGVGSHAEIYPVYLADPFDGREYTHAENGYIQVLLETGAAGATLLAAGIGLVVFWCAAGLARCRSRRLLACLGATSAGLTASLLHSMVDFVWYVPGCMVVVAVLAACACRGWQLAVADGPRALAPWTPPAYAAPAAVGILLLCGMVLLADRFGPAVAQVHWERYLLDLEYHRLAAADEELAGDAPKETEATVDERIHAAKKRIAQLNEVVAWQPGHARARLALAQSHLQLFDLIQASSVNPMSLPNVRDAAIGSMAHFPTRKARDEWLRRAVGDHCGHLELALRHTKAALAACPLQGQGYLYLAELAFLDGAGEAAKHACIQQALRVRPHDGHVLYSAANEAWLAGEPAQWLTLAKEAARASARCQKQLFEDLVANTPPAGIELMIDFIVEEFQPDLVGLGFLEEACRLRAQPEQLRRLREYYARRAEHEARSHRGAEAAGRWLVARSVYEQLGNRTEALRCAQSAYECHPNGYDVRFALARCLLDQELYAEAQVHIQWCLQRRSSDKRLENWYRRALAGRLDKQAHR